MKFQVKHINKWLQQLGMSQRIEMGSYWQTEEPVKCSNITFVSKDSKGNKINHSLSFGEFSEKLDGEATLLGHIRIDSYFTVNFDLSASDNFLESVKKLNKKYQSEWKLINNNSFKYVYEKYYGKGYMKSSGEEFFYPDAAEKSFSEIDIIVEEKKFFEYFKNVWAGSENLQVLNKLITDEKNGWSTLANTKGRILNYKLLYSSSYRDLENQVKEAIFNRWEPQGGVSSTSESLVQAMVKREQ